MTKKELEQKYGIQVNKIDNGYQVSPSYEYKLGNKVIVLDRSDYFGTKCYVLSIKDKEITNCWGKVLRWENKDEAISDIVRLLYNMMPENCYTMA